ncbi:HK97-gp10 family putative phage morphogenesis protein [Amphritea sp. HPY]|uniref:HK97-gp10 family putative phage morphogenesis protein n=1 Tax=Amphritea sp. HPY TaxID=3421652 RepID=UPI003D7D6881
MAEEYGVDLADTVEALEKFSNNIRIKVTRRASRKAAKLVEDAMILMTPRRTGDLLQSVKTKTKVDQGGGRAYALIGPFGKVMSVDHHGIAKKRSQSYKAWFLEYGTENMKAQPFIQPALDRKRRDVERVFEDEVEKELKKL